MGWLGAQDLARETRRSVYASLRGFYRWAVRAGHVEVSPADGLPSVRPEVPCPRPTPEVEYRRAVSAADPRVRLILRLAAQAGLRRAEIAQIHRRDLTSDLLGRSLIVHGKGGVVRVVPLPGPLALEVEAACAAGHGYAFPGEISGHLSARWVGKLATRALPEGWSLHSLRHRFATAAYGSERDLIAVQQLLGHASVATTQRYVATGQDRLRRAAAGAA